MKITWWNVNGLNKLNDACTHDLNLILCWNIICICETWALTKPQLPSVSKYYDIIFSPANKEKQKGRASGGLLILIKKGFSYSILSVTNLWIFVKITCPNGMDVTLGNVYVSPNYSMDEALNLLRSVLDELCVDHNNTIIGGDFNGRISDQNYLDGELAEEWGMLSFRISLDEVANRRGEMLVECMEEYGLVVLNGRTKGDIPGQFTYISQAGKSSVDLIWCHLELCKWVLELRVSDCILSSDHLPVTAYMDIECAGTSVTNSEAATVKISRYKWTENETKKDSFTWCLNSKFQSTEPADVYETLKRTVDEVVIQNELIQEVTLYTGNYSKKPWYNSECRELRFLTRKFHRKWRRNHKEEDMLQYLQYKKDYFKKCQILKTDHENGFKEKLRNIKHAGDFWKAVKSFRPKKENKCKQISIQAWSDHLSQIYPSLGNNGNKIIFTDVLRESMDSKFSFGELEKAIKQLKNNKSPGPDSILNEYMKVLGKDWKQSLLNFINYVFEGGQIPEDLTNSYMFMLYKKGDPSDPGNYRTIALLNNIFKLLTHMITQRVLCWSEDHKLFMEAQAGFRPGRGCVDNIFTFASIINLHLIKKRKLYVAFVDFKSAFSEVNHDLLFEKMFAFGISGKIISLIRTLYQQSQVQIRVEDKLTPPCKITKGVITGDSISPLNFVIFINDLEDYLRSHGMEGVSVTSTVDILLLLYADDLILMGSSPVDLQKKLTLLFSYCQENKMQVNESKSKVVIFRRGGRISRFDVFHYGDRRLEVCSDYNYLGILFSSHGVFHKASQQALSKGRLAIANVKNILSNSKTDSYEGRMKLFDAIVKTTVLYGAEVWGCRYAEVLEKCQSQFLKTVYCLPRCTPGYMLRLEMGVVKLDFHIFKQMVEWWLKLLVMSQDRYPRICYNQLIEQDLRSSNIEKYNWVSLLKTKLVQLGFSEVWEAQNVEMLRSRKLEMYEKYYKVLINKDWSSLEVSSFGGLFVDLKMKLNNYELGILFPSSYLLNNVTINKLRIVAQLRLAGKMVKIYLNGITYEWDQADLCTNCDLNIPETLQHFIVDCPLYKPVRDRFLPELSGTSQNVVILLKLGNRVKVNSIFYYVEAALKIRSFNRNE